MAVIKPFILLLCAPSLTRKHLQGLKAQSYFSVLHTCIYLPGRQVDGERAVSS